MLKMLAGRRLETMRVESLAVVRERRMLETQRSCGIILSVRAPAGEWRRLQLIPPGGSNTATLLSHWSGHGQGRLGDVDVTSWSGDLISSHQI